MHPYSAETYLPCSIPEIHYQSNRKPFSSIELNQKISLSEISAVPFFKGALLFFKERAFFFDNFEMLLEIDSQNTKLLKLFDKYPDSIQELEELNAIGAIVFDGNKHKLQYSKDAFAYKSDYLGENWQNFSLAPIVLELDITNTCNASCIHCSHNSLGLSSSLDFDLILRIFAQCKKYNIPELLIMGGEPLLHPRFIDILYAANNSGFKAVRTSTNGILVTPLITKHLSKLTNHVQVSIHGASAQIHDAITKTNGSFKKACQAVRSLRSTGIDTAISFTVMEKNIDDVPLMPDLALSLGANALRFLALSTIGRAHSLNPITIEQRDKVGIIIQSLYKKYSNADFNISVGGFPALAPITATATLYGCAAAKTHFHISFEAMVNPCGSIEGYEVCNLGTTDLLEAWHNEKLKLMRYLSNCDCSYKFICSGPCKADLNVPFDR